MAGGRFAPIASNVIRSFVTIAGVDEMAPMLQQRSRRLLTVCLAASVALHLVLLAVLPGFVEEYSPLDARVLEVVLLTADAPAVVAPEPRVPPNPPHTDRGMRGQQRMRTGEGSRPATRAEEPSRPEFKAPAASSATPPAAAPASESWASGGSGAHSVAEAGSEAPRPREAPEITPPTFNAAYLRNPVPRYPMIARRSGEQGTVTLRVLVTREGVPASVSVERTSGSGHLDSAALETVRTWRFVPARRGQQPIDAWVLVPVVFRLEGTS